MVEAIKVTTAEDLFKLPMGNGSRYELVHGELKTMAPAGFDHGEVTLLAAARLLNFVRPRRLGRVCGAETGFLLHRQPDHVRAADAAFITAVRLPLSRRLKGFSEIAPDLVVEVVSPSDRWTDVAAKAVDWLEHGVSVVWILDPETRTAQIWRATGVVDRRGNDEEIDAEPVIPGFRCATSEMFPDLTEDQP